MIKKRIISLILAAAAAATVLSACSETTAESSSENSAAASEGASQTEKITLTNVSYDPTRELYQNYNELFVDYYKTTYGGDIEVIQSHGGSGSQARSVIEGSEADVVTLALAHDITLIEQSGINPDPKSSGGACWNFLAAWKYALDKNSNDEEKAKDFVRKLYANVTVMDSGARGATTTFVENGQGDVLIAWENEAINSVKEYPDDYEIVTPSISILAQPSVAIVDANAEKNGTSDAAKIYLEYLYSDEAQKIIGENGYRPTNEEILNSFSDKFDLNVNLCTIDDFGGWDAAYETFFDDGAIFDEIYDY